MVGLERVVNVEALHRYLRSNGLAKYIPKSAKKAARTSTEQTQGEDPTINTTDVVLKTVPVPKLAGSK